MRNKHQSRHRNIHTPHQFYHRNSWEYQCQVDDDREDLEEDLFEECIDSGTFTQSTQDFSRLFIDVEVEG